jgi:hypothetical protein
MADKPMKVMGCGWLGGLIGALLGVVIGGLIGGFIGSHAYSDPGPGPGELLVKGIGGGKELRDYFHKMSVEGAKGISMMIGTCLGVMIGGIIGGIGGSVMGAGSAARTSSTLTENPPSVKDSRSANESEPPTESPDAELARLKERVT